MKKEIQDRIRQRHKLIYSFLWHTLAPFFRRRYNFEAEPLPKIDGPFLLVANHTMNLDPVFVGCSSREHMYFVAGEHVFRKGIASRLLEWLFAPISRAKGSTDAVSALQIIRALRSGANVCLFAEGNESFNGVTCPIFPATGKLAKASGATLITYKIEGGYFTRPRWSNTTRRGRMRGYPVNVYTPEQLKSMTSEQVNQAISNDLYEDAYARQRERRIRFRGRRLAEYLERSLFLCPVCGGINTLRSHNNRFFCSCGVNAIYQEDGMLSGNTPYSTVTEWDKWQLQRLPDLIKTKTATDEPIVSDDNVTLMRIEGKTHKAWVLERGKLRLFRDRLSIGKSELKIKDISAMDVALHSSIIFTAGDAYYQIDAPKNFCGRKYRLLFDLLKHGAYTSTT